MANVLNVQELHKRYGPRPIFNGVSFSADEGEEVGFIGVNGSGNSTLFRIVAGAEPPDGGTLAFQRAIRVGYLSQEPEFAENDTILSAAASGRPELMEAIGDYHEVSAALAAGEGGAERLLARQDKAAAPIDA